MDFRIVVLSLTFWLAPVWASTSVPLDTIDTLIYQYPSAALIEINDLEAISSPVKLSETEKLRLALFRCETFLQLGENEAAINLARISEAKAKILKLEQARPYFLNCMAGAFTNYGDFRQALPILDSSILLSRELKQPQSLVNGLRLRGIIDTQVDSYSSAFEDLSLAIDIYPDAQNQEQGWTLPPLIYIQIPLSKLLAKKTKIRQAFEIIERAADSKEFQGKVRVVLTTHMAKMAQLNQYSSSDNLIQQAKTLLPELGTAFELAISYTEMAQLEYKRKNFIRAIQLLEISLNTFKKQKKTIEELRAQRLLGEVLLASGNTDKALKLINKSISAGLRTSHYAELILSYQVLGSYYASIGDFKQAHLYQLKRFDAAENSFNFIKDTRLLQLNARVSRQQQVFKTELLQSNSSINVGQGFKSGYIAILLTLLFGFILGVITIRYKKRTIQAPLAIEPQSREHKIERLISNSKQAGYPLSLVVIHTADVYQTNLPLLISRIENLLRDQDLVINREDGELLLLLPHTKEGGTLRVIEQIKEIITPLLNGNKTKIGYARMQQHDSLSSLIKRAHIQQLRQTKIDKEPTG
ncbi:response regulator receiver protein [Shewanella sediminis HAW-EB3]|uniref:Response regulator receiver protein n=1 Tax=Shewanella sediminis (strain HAW-EB3) TaxID=425104 RepID=A8FQ82_SHESH|nr:tetratricopeptide repeat protein [Shewanella sediminis]ABV35005.1 response regulator receiver protein [Shewanella sediminis HAW-EB3]